MVKIETKEIKMLRIFVIDWRVWKLLIMFGNYVLSTSFTPYHAWPGPVASSVTPMDSRCRKISKMSHLNFHKFCQEYDFSCPKTSRSLLLWFGRFSRLRSKCCKMRHFARIFHHSVFAYCPTIWRTFWFFSQKRQENLRKSFWGILTKPFLILC